MTSAPVAGYFWLIGSFPRSWLLQPECSAFPYWSNNRFMCRPHQLWCSGHLPFFSNPSIFLTTRAIQVTAGGGGRVAFRGLLGLAAVQESPGRVGKPACCGPTTCFINTQLHSASPSTLPCCCCWSGLHGLIASMSWRGKESTVQCLACMNITHGMICSCGVSDVQCSLILKLNSHHFRLSCQCFDCKIEVKLS